MYPKTRTWIKKHNNEDEDLTALGDIGHVDPLLVGHEAEEGEDDDPRKHRRTAVHAADDQRVLKFRKDPIMVKKKQASTVSQPLLPCQYS